MISAFNDQDKFGYYSVGDLKFYSKLEAAEMKKSLNLSAPIVWHFNDEVYSSYDWTIEPTESLAELYKRRAQQIRDKYDYLVLFFSGGADSTNVLNSFIDNDIRIDELVNKVNYDATGDRFNFMNGEIYNVAIPKVQEVKLKQPWIKHTVIDLSNRVMSAFAEKETKFDWVYGMNSTVNPNNYSSKDIKTSQPHWRDMLDAGKRVCFIHGVDKPRLANVGSKFVFWFIDTMDLASSPKMQMANEPGHYDELFYWSADLPEIPIKQAHEIKRVLKTLTLDSPYASRVAHGTSFTIYDKKPLYFKSDGMHKLIYPNWYPVPYQIKAMSLLFTPRDEWFFKLPDSDPAKRAWKLGVEHMWNTLPVEMRTTKNDISGGFKYMHSKKYNLGE